MLFPLAGYRGIYLIHQLNRETGLGDEDLFLFQPGISQVKVMIPVNAIN